MDEMQQFFRASWLVLEEIQGIIQALVGLLCPGTALCPSTLGLPLGTVSWGASKLLAPHEEVGWDNPRAPG